MRRSRLLSSSAGSVGALFALPVLITAQSADARYVGEVERIMSHPAVGQAIEGAEDLDAWGMDLLVELTEIPAPPFLEEARAKRFAELLEELGADSVWIDEEGNAIGLRRGRTGRRTVAIGGHLDTVFPEGTDVRVRMRGDTLFAPGVGDDTRGLVVVLSILRALEEAEVETEDHVLFIGTVGEEGLGDLRGMKYLFREGADPIHSWIEIDGSDNDELTTQGLGSVRYRVTFEGPGGHSWSDFGLANPSHAMARAIRYFQDAADQLTRSGPTTSYNVGRIGGGTSVNAVPYEAWMEVDMRSVSPASLQTIESALLEAVERALSEENELRRAGAALTVDPARIGDRPSGDQDPSVPLIQRAMAVTEAYGGEPRFDRSSTNSNVPIALGVPAVTLSRGGEGDDNHSPGEWWLNRDAYRAVQRALVVLVAEAGLAGLIP